MKGAIYYVAIARVIFSHVKITCYFHVWRYQVFVRKLTWYFIGVCIIKNVICCCCPLFSYAFPVFPFIPMFSYVSPFFLKFYHIFSSGLFSPCFSVSLCIPVCFHVFPWILVFSPACFPMFCHVPRIFYVFLFSPRFPPFSLVFLWFLRICSCLACVYRVMDARRKFGEHERWVRVARDDSRVQL